MIKRLLPILISVTLTAGSIPARPVYAAEPAAVQEESTTDEEIQTGTSSEAEVNSDSVEESTATDSDVETDDENTSEEESASEQEAEESEIPDEDPTETETVTEPVAEDEAEDPELLGHTGTGYDLEGEVDASFFANLEYQMRNLYLTGDCTIVLHDDDDFTISTINKDTDESDYTLTIKPAEGSQGNGKITINSLSLGKKCNSFIVEGGHVYVKYGFDFGKLLKLCDGELFASQRMMGKDVLISGGKLHSTANSTFYENNMNLGGDLTVAGGIVDLVNCRTSAIYTSGSVILTGGSVSVVSLVSSNAISFLKEMSVSGTAVLYAQGTGTAITGGHKITIDDTHKIVCPEGGGLVEDSNGSDYFVNKDGKRIGLNIIKIVPVDYTDPITSDVTECDFGNVMTGYDEDAIDSMTITLTNESTEPISFIEPVSTKYLIEFDEESLKNVPVNGTVSFSVKPITGLKEGMHSELLSFTTEDGKNTSVLLKVKVGNYLSGNIEASTLQKNTTYELIGDTVIHIAESDDITINELICAGNSLTITGEETGKLTVTEDVELNQKNSYDAVFKLTSGTLQCRSVYNGYGAVVISGGKLLATERVSSGGSLSVTGGELRILSGSTSYSGIYADGVYISGGIVDVNNNYERDGIQSTEDLSIAHATVNVRTNGSYGLTASKGILLDKESEVYIKAASEAIYVPGNNWNYSINLDDSLRIQAPIGGRVYIDDQDHKVHILNSVGNYAKTVRIGTGDIISGLSVNADVLDYGRIPIGYKEAPASKTLTVTNNTSKSVTINLSSLNYYKITPNDTTHTIKSGKSLSFVIQPKNGLEPEHLNEPGNDNRTLNASETLTVSTSDGSDSVNVELELFVGTYLTGYMEAEDLVAGGIYNIIDDTELHIGSEVNKVIHAINWEKNNPCKLTISGDSSGKLFLNQGITSQFPGNELIISGGTIETSSGAGISPQGDIRITGGNITTGHIRNSDYNLIVSGGTVATGLTNESSIKAKNITIKDDAVSVTASTVYGSEAITLSDYSKGKIVIGNDQIVTAPLYGFIATEGSNAGHIVTEAGELAKNVCIELKPEDMEPTPAATYDPDINMLTGLVSNADYSISGTGITQTAEISDEEGRIAVNPEWYAKTLKIIKTGPDSSLNSMPQRLKIDVSIPTDIPITVPVPLTGKTPISVYDTGSYYYTCKNVAWAPEVAEGLFAEGTPYSVTLTLSAEGSLTFKDKTNIIFNGKNTNYELSDDSKTITVTVQFDATESIVHVSSFGLTPKPVILTESGPAVDVTASIYPEEADNRSFTAAIGDKKIAVVSDTDREEIKSISPVAVGRTYIRLTANDNNVSADFPVYVRYKTPKAEHSGENLTGLIPNQHYFVHSDKDENKAYTEADRNGCVPMRTQWYDSTVYITAANELLPEECYSVTQVIKTGREIRVPVKGLYARFSDFADNEEVEYKYTGMAIKPDIDVYNNGRKLIPGTDYTVKYSGNISVVRDKKTGEVKRNRAKVLITGKGNLTGSKTLWFTIIPRGLTDPDMKFGSIRVVKDSKASPVITYKGYRLTNKDYVITDPNKKYTEHSDMEITGKGNFSGTKSVRVTVVYEKGDLKKQTVVLMSSRVAFNPGTDEATTVNNIKKAISDSVRIYDLTDKHKTTPLKEERDYVIDYPDSLKEAGKKKITIVGVGAYMGTTTKTVTVKPLAVKTDGSNGTVVTNAESIAAYEYVFDSKGVTVTREGTEIPSLAVTYIPMGSTEPITLIRDVDYKVTYSNNKKVSTTKKPAKYTITFIGNYKGTPAIKNNTFTIVPKPIASITETKAEGVDIKIPDMMYNGKPGLFKSAPYITVDGVSIASGNYKVSYYTDIELTKEVNKSNKVSIENGKDTTVVYVRITGKGNYTGVISKDLSYMVHRKAETVYDMSKARVTIYKAKYDPAKGKGKKLMSVTYTGEPIEIKDGDKENGVGTIIVDYKVNGKQYIRLKENIDYKIEYLNNREKGTAIIMIRGTDTENDSVCFIGTKKATFKITASNLKTFLKTFADIFSS